MRNLESIGMPITIWTTPVQVQDRTPFEKDEKHAAYDPKYAQRRGNRRNRTRNSKSGFVMILKYISIGYH